MLVGSCPLCPTEWWWYVLRCVWLACLCLHLFRFRLCWLFLCFFANWEKMFAVFVVSVNRLTIKNNERKQQENQKNENEEQDNRKHIWIQGGVVCIVWYSKNALQNPTRKHESSHIKNIINATSLIYCFPEKIMLNNSLLQCTIPIDWTNLASWHIHFAAPCWHYINFTFKCQCFHFHYFVVFVVFRCFYCIFWSIYKTTAYKGKKILTLAAF